MSRKAAQSASGILYRESESAEGEADAAAIEAGLDRHGYQAFGQPRMPLLITAYDGEVLAGGMNGVSLGENFYIKHLWVDDTYRRSGIGRTLLQKAEGAARNRSCRIVWVDTMSYQAPEFYPLCGYIERARVARYRDGHDRIFYAKEV